jgi:hypothetical protein
MTDSRKNALVLHVATGGEPLVYALSVAEAKELAGRLQTLMTTGAVVTPELEDGSKVAINFAHIVTAHFDELPPMSRVYGAPKTTRGFNT